MSLVLGSTHFVADDALTSNDVLLGRGAFVDRFQGNIHFRALLRKCKSAYSAATSDHAKKMDIARQVVSIIQAKQGRFLRKIKSENPDSLPHWEIVDNLIALEKVKQALRDMSMREPDAPIASSSSQPLAQVTAVPPLDKDPTTSRNEVTLETCESILALRGSQPHAQDHASVSRPEHETTNQSSDVAPCATGNSFDIVSLMRQHAGPSQAMHSIESLRAPHINTNVSNRFNAPVDGPETLLLDRKPAARLDGTANVSAPPRLNAALSRATGVETPDPVDRRWASSGLQEINPTHGNLNSAELERAAFQAQRLLPPPLASRDELAFPSAAAAINRPATLESFDRDRNILERLTRASQGQRDNIGGALYADAPSIANHRLGNMHSNGMSGWGGERVRGRHGTLGHNGVALHPFTTLASTAVNNTFASMTPPTVPHNVALPPRVELAESVYHGVASSWRQLPRNYLEILPMVRDGRVHVFASDDWEILRLTLSRAQLAGDAMCLAEIRTVLIQIIELPPFRVQLHQNERDALIAALVSLGF